MKTNLKKQSPSSDSDIGQIIFNKFKEEVSKNPKAKQIFTKEVNSLVYRIFKTSLYAYSKKTHANNNNLLDIIQKQKNIIKKYKEEQATGEPSLSFLKTRRNEILETCRARKSLTEQQVRDEMNINYALCVDIDTRAKLLKDIKDFEHYGEQRETELIVEVVDYTKLPSFNAETDQLIQDMKEHKNVFISGHKDKSLLPHPPEAGRLNIDDDIE